MERNPNGLRHASCKYHFAAHANDKLTAQQTRNSPRHDSRPSLNAEISFKELARQTGLGEKSLHRMLHRNGNPTARNLGVIIKSIAEDLDIKPRVEVAACR